MALIYLVQKMVYKVQAYNLFPSLVSNAIISGYAEIMALETGEGNKLYTVGNMLCCYVSSTLDTGQLKNNYCIHNAEQCYPAFIIYYKAY